MTEDKKFTLDSTIKEIMGEPKGNRCPDRLLALLRVILEALAPDCKWYVDRSYHHTELGITAIRNGEFRGAGLPLDEKRDIGYFIHCVILRLSHHDEWHKGLSIGGLTINPYEWYSTVEEQIKFLDNHPEQTDRIFEKAGVLEEVNEIRQMLKK